MSLLITATELEDRLDRAEIVYKRLGRGSDSTPRPRGELAKNGIPTFVRELIAGEARSEVAKNTEIAEEWGVSATTVRYAEEGRIGPHQKKGEETALVEKADRISGRITEDILDITANKLLETMTKVKISDDEKPIVQTSIARNLATVYEKLKPAIVQQTNIQYNVFVPTMKKVDDFGPAIRVVEQDIKR